MTRTHRRVAPFARPALAAALVMPFVLSACGSDSLEGVEGSSSGSESSSESALPEADPELAALVPEEMRSKGTLTIGTAPGYAPNEFLGDDGSTIEGMDVDLFDAVAAKLDLKTAWQGGQFDGLILGVDSGKYDVVVSGVTVKPERTEQVDMVGYFDAGTQWLTKAGNPAGVDPDDACGKRVGVQVGTVQVDDLEARSTACEKAGKPAIKQIVEKQQSTVTASLVSGKIDATLADSPVGGYAVKQTGDQLETLGDIYDSAPYGIVVPKDDKELTEAITKAFESLAADGSYEEILTRWGTQDGAVESFELNPS